MNKTCLGRDVIGGAAQALMWLPEEKTMAAIDCAFEALAAAEEQRRLERSATWQNSGAVRPALRSKRREEAAAWKRYHALIKQHRTTKAEP